MKYLQSIIATILFTSLLLACENRDINEGEQFKPREIHEDITFHFDKIEVDGIEYLILEKDNNNPHEGFGFMAFRANKMMEKQDSMIAHLRTIQDIQIRIYAAMTRRPLPQIEEEANDLFQYYLDSESVELEKLEQNQLKSSNTITPDEAEAMEDNN